MRQKRSSKITPMSFSSQSLASYLAENGHDIRQLTIDKLTRLTLRTDDLYIQIEEMPM
jgi:hypothetical protein